MQYLQNSPGGSVVAPFPPAHRKNRPETKARMEKKTTIGNQTEPATDLPHFAILVYVIKPKAGFVGGHNPGVCFPGGEGRVVGV